MLVGCCCCFVIVVVSYESVRFHCCLSIAGFITCTLIGIVPMSINSSSTRSVRKCLQQRQELTVLSVKGGQ